MTRLPFPSGELHTIDWRVLRRRWIRMFGDAR